MSPLKIYYAAAIDNCADKGKEQLEQFKQLLNKYPVELRGAGIGDSPIIKLDSSPCVKGVICAHDLKEIRECDIFLVVLNSKSQAVATFMELEYARQLGLYTIILILSKIKEKCSLCDGSGILQGKLCSRCGGEMVVSVPDKTKSIFLETYANLILYSTEELEKILKDLTDKGNEE